MKLSKILSISSLLVVFSISSVLANDTAVISDNRVNIRSASSLNSDILDQYNRGDSLNIVGRSGEWIRIDHPTNGHAYVNKDFISVPETQARISGNNINVRSNPNTNANVIDRLQDGDTVTVTARGQNWFVVNYNGTNAYIHSDFLSGENLDLLTTVTLDESLPETASNSGPMYAIVTSSTGVNLRAEASTSSRVLRLMSSDEVMTVLEVNGDWAKVDLDGLVGYANTEFINIRRGERPSRSGATYSNTGVEVVEYSKQFLGNPYRWGGTSLTNGADCSGFVQSVMRHFGIQVSRTSRDQATNGVPVDRSELRAGDLVFFGRSGISHVGIYMGDGNFIHASDETVGIVTTPLSKRTDFVTARRVIK